MIGGGGKTIGEREMPGISALKSQHTKVDPLPTDPLYSLHFRRIRLSVRNSDGDSDLLGQSLDKCISWHVRPDKNLIQSRSPKEGNGEGEGGDKKFNTPEEEETGGECRVGSGPPISIGFTWRAACRQGLLVN